MFFRSKNKQTQYFTRKTYKTLNNSQWTRIESNKVKLPYGKEELDTCTYMSIENEDSKVFYCFIENCEYVSPTCSVVTFKIDVVQTFMFDVNWGKQFIERCHESDDAFGVNMIPENISVDRSYVQKRRKLMTVSEMSLWIVVYVSKIIEDPTGTSGATYGPKIVKPCNVTIDGIVYGFDMEREKHIYDFMEMQKANMFLDPNYVISMTVAPAVCVPVEDADYTYPNEPTIHNTIDHDYWVAFMKRHNVRTSQIHSGGDVINYADYTTLDKSFVAVRPTVIEGHTIRNKKIYQYPFTSLRVFTVDGCELELKPEYFAYSSQGVYNFMVYGSFLGKSSMIVRPKNYQLDINQTDDLERKDYSVELTGFCEPVWNKSAYEMWKSSQEQATNWATGISLVGDSVLSITGAISGNPIAMTRGVTAIGSDIASRVREEVKAEHQPNVHGGASTGNTVNTVHLDMNFFVEIRTVDRDTLQMLDDYFDRNGYAQERIMNLYDCMTNRQKWNYVQTKNCALTGDFNASYQNELQNIFNAGIRLWHDDGTASNYIGKYENTNPAFAPTYTISLTADDAYQVYRDDEIVIVASYDENEIVSYLQSTPTPRNIVVQEVFADFINSQTYSMLEDLTTALTTAQLSYTISCDTALSVTFNEFNTTLVDSITGAEVEYNDSTHLTDMTTIIGRCSQYLNSCDITADSSILYFNSTMYNGLLSYLQTNQIAYDLHYTTLTPASTLNVWFSHGTAYVEVAHGGVYSSYSYPDGEGAGLRCASYYGTGTATVEIEVILADFDENEDAYSETVYELQTNNIPFHVEWVQ